jgi:uncharacterized protein YtpQ (UPF0354 family)
MRTNTHMGERLFTQRCIVALSKAGFIAKEMGLLTIGIRRSSFSAVQEFRDLYASYLLEEPTEAEKMIAAAVADLSSTHKQVTHSQELLSLGIVFPMLRRTKSLAPDAIATTWVEGVSVVYAADLPTHWQFIDEPILNQWGVGPSELHGLAVSNLLRRTQAMEASVLPGNPPFKMYSTGDGFDAARALILAELEPTATALTFGVPTRNQLLYVPSGTLPEAFGAALRAQVEQDFHTLDHPVSQHLWHLEDGVVSQVA